MKKQSLSSRSNSLHSIMIVGLMSVLFLISASNAPATNSASATTAASHSMPEQKKRPTPLSSTNAPKAVKARLTELFGICKSDDLETAAAYFVYRGPDKSREWKDVYRASDSEEMASVKSLCRRIKGYLDESDGYEFGAVKVERESEGKWHVLEVSFQQREQTKKALFAFLLIKGQFAIGDID